MTSQADKNILVTYGDIKLYVDGALITLKDENGNSVEPFICNGAVYVPINAVGEALGKEVYWDNDTSSIYIDGRSSKPPIAAPLYNKPYLKVENAEWFSTGGNDGSNFIKLHPRNVSFKNVIRGQQWQNSVTYLLNAAALRFKANIAQASNWGAVETEYKIYGDDELLYNSPCMRNNAAPISIDINVEEVMQLRIELSITSIGQYDGINFYEYRGAGYRGIENAVVVTTNY